MKFRISDDVLVVLFLVGITIAGCCFGYFVNWLSRFLRYLWAG